MRHKLWSLLAPYVAGLCMLIGFALLLYVPRFLLLGLWQRLGWPSDGWWQVLIYWLSLLISGGVLQLIYKIKRPDE